MTQKPIQQRRSTARPAGEAVFIAAEAALEKKAEDLVILDLRDLVSFADYFIICSGTSKKQVQAIADSVTASLKLAGRRTLHVEGYSRGEWVLLDYGETVVHVFGSEARSFYDLERLWRDAKPIRAAGTESSRRRASTGRRRPKSG